MQMHREKAVWGMGGGFPQPSALWCWNGSPEACSQPMHWGCCLQTLGDISCSMSFIVAGLFAVKCRLCAENTNFFWITWFSAMKTSGFAKKMREGEMKIR